MVFLITIYIKELEKSDKIKFLEMIPKFLRKILIKIIKITNNFFINKIDDNKKIYIIPDINRKKVYEKILRTLKKEQTQTQKVQIVLSKDIKKYKSYFEKISIVDGKIVIRDSIYQIIKKAIGNNNVALYDVYILTNKYNDFSNRIIKDLLEKVKSVNIITKEINKYNMLEEKYEKEGLLITVSNNKKKSLKKAKIIINIDFTKEELKSYSIFRNSFLINLHDEKIDFLRGFDGIIIQNIEVEYKSNQKDFVIENNLKEKFKQIEVYESLLNIYDKRKENINIITLYGNNGKINEKELLNWQKILTN